jgi:hypothetical protein
MLFTPDHFIRKEALTRHLENAQEPSANLIREVIEEACVRLPLLKKAGKANNIDQLIEAGAWCDAVLALIDIELPGWKLRRLIRENSEWFCSLSRQPDLPVELDDTADASHEVMVLAILGAFLEARDKSAALRGSPKPTVPALRPSTDRTICCDNFA